MSRRQSIHPSASQVSGTAWQKACRRAWNRESTPEAPRARHPRYRGRQDSARLDDPDPEGGGLLVSRAGDLGRLAHGWEPLGGMSSAASTSSLQRRYLRRQEQRARRVRGVYRPLAGQAEANVVLGKHDPADARVHVRLVTAQPEQLRSCEARECAVAGEGDQPLETNTLLDLGALDPRALVVQRMAGRRTRSCSSRQTSPCIWPERPMRGVSTPRRASALSLACSQSSGSCSDRLGGASSASSPPPLRRRPRPPG